MRSVDVICEGIESSRLEAFNRFVSMSFYKFAQNKIIYICIETH